VDNIALKLRQVTNWIFSRTLCIVNEWCQPKKNSKGPPFQRSTMVGVRVNVRVSLVLSRVLSLSEMCFWQPVRMAALRNGGPKSSE